MTSRQARLWMKKLATDSSNMLVLMSTDAKSDEFSFRKGTSWVSVHTNCERIIFSDDNYGHRLLGTLKIKEIHDIVQLKEALNTIDLSREVEY